MPIYLLMHGFVHTVFYFGSLLRYPAAIPYQLLQQPPTFERLLWSDG